MATRIDGKALAAQVKARTAEAAKDLPRRPGLAVILVGDDPASRVYVTGKEKDCAECGFLSFEHALPADTAQETLMALIEELNRAISIYDAAAKTGSEALDLLVVEKTLLCEKKQKSVNIDSCFYLSIISLVLAQE